MNEKPETMAELRIHTQLLEDKLLELENKVRNEYNSTRELREIRILLAKIVDRGLYIIQTK